MLEDPELFLSDKIVTIIISFVTVQSFCIARMVFRLLRNLLKPKLNCEKLTKDMKDTLSLRVARSGTKKPDTT